MEVEDAKEDFLEVTRCDDAYLLTAGLAEDGAFDSVAFEAALLADIDKRPLRVTIAS